MRTRTGTALLLALVTMLAACSSSDSDSASRKNVLTDLANQIIVPAYEVTVTRADDLIAQTERMCADPTAENKTAVLESVDDTRAAWKESESVWVGPVMDSRSWALIDYPVNAGDIEKVLSNTSLPTIDQDVVTNRIGADERGLAAIEYLSSSDLHDQRRCAYVKAAAATIDTEAKRILSAWTTDVGDEPAYQSVFSGHDETSDVDMSLDDVVNDQINLLRAMGDQELGAALGNESKPANPEALVEARPGEAITAERARLAGIRLTLVGDADRRGLSVLLGDELRARITTSADAAELALSKIDGGFRDALANDRADVQAAKEALDELRRVLSTEVVSHLGVALGFSDADGDSAK